ncbi:hypothetical protein LTR08_004370 [Meristemomyces frigidus]|nr:hypothetical protein LTR08_004370 [Meristemomyces frigidus]
MSYMPRAQQPNGNDANYLNGDGRLGRFNFDATPDTSADERSRSRGPGAYGGFASQQAEHVRGPARIERQHANRRSRGEEWSASRSRSRPAVARYGAAGSQVEEILRYISQQWSFMASDACIPIKVALQLMDPSSLGLADQYDSFQEVHQQLQTALKVIVNEHHQGFNSSIGTYHKIQAAIHASQHRVRTLRAGLVQAKASLSTPRPDLRAFATSSQSYDQMLQIVGHVEQLQAVPERLEAQISEKRFLGAVATLQEALALIRKPEMEDIGALSELRVYLSNQEHSLTDILIEELHSHLYLKSPYCEERWKTHSRQATSANATVSDDDRAMHSFLETYDGRQPMQEDATRNPEANTFYYIQLLIESLNSMNRLDVAVDAIEQRLPVELFRVVERSHTEVEQRHPSTMRTAAARTRQQAMGRLGATRNGEQKATLEDLLTTLYAKFEAIAEGHRVLHDVTGAILKREPQSDAATLNRSFREMWKLLQSEIRSLLHDHLATSGSLGGQRSNENDPSANIFRPQPRDRNRKLFKIADTDGKSTDLATEREDLEFILKASVPGLVNTSLQRAKNAQSDNDSNPTDRSATGHKLLVEPSVFNMSTLLPPSLLFLTRLRDIVPPNSGVVANTLTSFLDDFLINVFYPQLDETLLDLCGRSLSDPEAFQPDPSWPEHAARPIFKGTVRFFEVVEVVCGMLDALPHEQSFSGLVVQQLRGYYDRCYQWSKSLLQRSMAAQFDGSDAGARMRMAATLATSGEVNDAVIELLKAQTGGEEKVQLVLAEKESALLINIVKRRKLEEADLINDRKALVALCTLHVSMKWLAAKCQGLRYLSPRAVDMMDNNHQNGDDGGQNHHLTRRWTTSLHNAPSGVYLPLDEQSAQAFDAVLVSFTELNTLILRTLHLDIRLHLLQGIYAAMDTTYQLGQPYNDPDPAVLKLSESLSTYDGVIAVQLLTPQYEFLTANLAILVNNALISFVRAIPAMDDFGNRRMLLNVLVLQQALQGLSKPSGKSGAANTGQSARRFYELAELGPAEVVGKGVGEGFAREDLKALVRLCWEPERDAERGGVEEFVGRLG